MDGVPILDSDTAAATVSGLSPVAATPQSRVRVDGLASSLLSAIAQATLCGVAVFHVGVALAFAFPSWSEEEVPRGFFLLHPTEYLALIDVVAPCVDVTGLLSVAVWFHAAASDAAALRSIKDGLLARWVATLSFLFPGAQIVWPWVAMRALRRASDPRLFPDAQLDLDQSARGYREEPVRRGNTRVPDPRFDGWLASWVVLASASHLPALSSPGVVACLSVGELLTSLFALFWIQSIDLRLRESARRRRGTESGLSEPLLRPHRWAQALAFAATTVPVGGLTFLVGAWAFSGPSHFGTITVTALATLGAASLGWIAGRRGLLTTTAAPVLYASLPLLLAVVSLRGVVHREREGTAELESALHSLIVAGKSNLSPSDHRNGTDFDQAAERFDALTQSIPSPTAARLHCFAERARRVVHMGRALVDVDARLRLDLDVLLDPTPTLTKREGYDRYVRAHEYEETATRFVSSIGAEDDALATCLAVIGLIPPEIAQATLKAEPVTTAAVTRLAKAREGLTASVLMDVARLQSKRSHGSESDTEETLRGATDLLSTLRVSLVTRRREYESALRALGYHRTRDESPHPALIEAAREHGPTGDPPKPPIDLELITYPSPIGPLPQYATRPSADAPHSAVLFVPSSDAFAEDLSVAARLSHGGYVVALPTLPGQLRNPAPTDRDDDVDALLAALSTLSARPDVNTKSIVMVGAGAATGRVLRAAARTKGIRGAIAFDGPFSEEVDPRDQRAGRVDLAAAIPTLRALTVPTYLVSGDAARLVEVDELEETSSGFFHARGCPLSSPCDETALYALLRGRLEETGPLVLAEDQGWLSLP